MENQQIKKLNFSIDDFELLINGLEALPKAKMGGVIMGMMFESIISRDDEAMQAKLEKERRRRELEMKKEEDAQNENIQLLKAKLISFKRLLIQDNLIGDVHQIFE